MKLICLPSAKSEIGDVQVDAASVSDFFLARESMLGKRTRVLTQQ